MPKELRSLCIILSSLLLLGLIVWICCFPDRPGYKGRTLESWLDTYFAAGVENKDVVAADNAIRHMGTHSLPFLIAMIDGEDSHTKILLLNLSKKVPFLDLDTTSASVRRVRAVEAFKVLGSVARPAIPALIERLRDGGEWDQAANALFAIGPESIDPLIQALQKNDAKKRAAIANVLGDFASLPGAHFERPTEWSRTDPETRKELEACAEKIVSALLPCLNDPVSDVQNNSIRSLSLYRKKAEVLVPRFKELLQASNYQTRILAVQALGRFGGAAQTALPELILVLHDSNPTMRTAVDQALRAIDPGSAAPALAEELK